jgi:hypothetical protein
MFTLASTFDAPLTMCNTTPASGSNLSARERALAVLTGVCVLKDHDLLEQAVICAKQVGLTDTEIGQTSAIALAVQEICQRYGLHDERGWPWTSSPACMPGLPPLQCPRP